MKTLFIDIASHQAVVACVTPDAVESIWSEEMRVDDHALIPRIVEVLEQAKWKQEDITNVACIIGPGGFTSLRIAVACANTFAHELKIPAAGVHLSDLYAARVDQSCLWLHSTKRSELFARSLGDGPWQEPTHLQLEDFLQKVDKNQAWCGELIEEHQAAVDELGFASVQLKPAPDVLPALLSDQEYKEGLLQPWYGRDW